MSAIDVDPDVPSSGMNHRLTGGTLLASVVAVMVAQIGLSIPAVLNGMIQRDLDTTSAQLTWVSAAFLVPITLLELSCGVLGDLFGRKRLLAIGSSLVTVGMLLAYLTPTGGSHAVQMTFLFGGQVIGGIGAAALFPTSVAMLAAGTHTVKERSKSISIWAAALTAGGFISPVMAGVLAELPHDGGENASWRYGFLGLAVLGAISTVITLAFARNSSSPKGRSLDIPGQVTVAIGLFALVFGVIQGSEGDWSSPLVVGSFVAAVVFLAAFVVIERRTAQPLVQLDLFANRVFVVTAIVTVLSMFAYLGTAYATSIRLSAIQGYSPLMTSVGFVCLNIMGVVLFPVSSRLLQHYNPGWILAVGAALIGVGDVALALIPATNLSIAAIAFPLLVIGAGFKLAVTSITSVSVNSVPTSKAGMASGMTSMIRDFGLTLGPSVIGAIALTRAASEISQNVAASPQLTSALDAFNASPQNAPAPAQAELQGAVNAVNSGPIGANGVPSTVTMPDGSIHPLNPIKDVAFHALSNGYAIGYLVCGIAAILAAVIAAALLGGRPHHNVFADEEHAMDH
ncbi:MFS transporter [Gordonia sp. SL306]|uniref:MFS transporter n=1 Tax=Gordonia sp. SL306 TaxID=2995145 RepID=UPI0022711AC5|nr:MFS transporter [Gordonia sp. SL306]WAC54552.1 MFS transporter [Gordonia sp. SL306]